MTTMMQTARTQGSRRATLRSNEADGGRGHVYRYRRGAGALSPVEALILVLIVVFLLVSAVASRYGGRNSVDRTSSFKVSPGQTLWAIAQQHPIDGLSTAQTADIIAELNNLEAGALRAGSIIRVPAQASANTALASR